MLIKKLLPLLPVVAALAGSPRPLPASHPGYRRPPRLDIQDFTTLVIREPKDLFLFGAPPPGVPLMLPPVRPGQPADLPDRIDGDLPGGGGPKPDLGELVARDFQSCRACHEGAARKGGVLLFQGGRLAPNVKAASVEAAVESDSMPPDPRPKLTVEQKARFKEWAASQK